MIAVRRKSRVQEPRRGAAALEFALIAPMLVFMFLGMIEITRGLQVRNTLSDAARQACRLGIQAGYDNASVKSAVDSILQQNGINPAQASLEIQVNGKAADVKTALPNDRISARIQVPADKVGWIATLFLTGRNIEAGPLHMMRQN